MLGESRTIPRPGLPRGRRLASGPSLTSPCRAGAVAGVHDADAGPCNPVCLAVGPLCWGSRAGLGINQRGGRGAACGFLAMWLALGVVSMPVALSVPAPVEFGGALKYSLSTIERGAPRTPDLLEPHA